jgi:hypothetical protein
MPERWPAAGGPGPDQYGKVADLGAREVEEREGMRRWELGAGRWRRDGAEGGGGGWEMEEGRMWRFGREI